VKLVQAARGRATALYLLVVLLAAAGVYRVLGLPSSIFPDVTFPLVKVIASVGNEPAATMMPTATRPLEEAIRRVPGMQLVRSVTSRGSSEISAQFAWGTNMQVAVQRVQAEVQRMLPGLPPSTTVDVQWMNPATFPIQGYALTSNTQSQAQLWELAEYTLKPALIRIPGVSQVQIQGGSQREFQVVLSRQALDGRKLTAADVVNAIKQNNTVLSAGFTEQNHELYLTLVDGRVASIAQLSSLSVPTPVGPAVPLGQLGTVRVADQVSYVRTTADGQPAVLVNVVRQPSANTVAIATGVADLFRTQPGLLPAGVRWSNFYDQGKFVADSLTGVRDAILIGVGLAALVLFAFLRKWRLMVVAVVAIPLTVAIVALALSALGQTLNLMTLAGIAAALGLIADDAIVVIENIERHQEEDTSGDPAAAGVDEIFSALVGSSLSTIVILLPFVLVTGVVGAFFKPLALTLALALVVSFCVALFVVPVSISLFAPAKPKPAAMPNASPHAPPARPGRWARLTAPVRRVSHRVTHAGGRGYAAVTGFVLRHGIVAAAATAGLIGVTYVLYGRIGTDFLPHMDEGSIIMDYHTPPGTSLAETDAILTDAERVITAIPDVASYSRRTGTQLGFFITEPNSGDYVIKLKPMGQRRGVDAVITTIRTRLAAMEPALHADFGQLLEDNIGDLTGGAPQPIDARIFGNDPAQLQRTAQHVAAAVKSVRGVTSVSDGVVIAGPALDVRLDPIAAAQYGLTAQTVRAAIEPAVVGTVANQLRIADRLYDVRVLAPTSGPLADVKIHTPPPALGLVPLSAVATIGTGQPEVEIDRENLRSYVGVTARISGRDLGHTMAGVRQAITQQVQLPPGMRISYGGLYQQQQQSFRSLLYVLLGGLLLVSVVVLFEFADWRAPVIVSLCAVAVLAGVLGALHLSGMTLNISSYVGAIMMVGIVGENAIFVIHEARLALEGGATPEEAWTRAAHKRLRPVAMTILATALALSPLALALGQGAQLIQPLAIAVIGGFVLSGPIVLWLLPGLYHLLDPHGRLGGRAEPNDA